MVAPDHTDIKAAFARISVWKRGEERAPHKPLLLLLALARCARGADRFIPFDQVDAELTELLREFGPTRQSYHPEYPFWRLQADGLWELRNAEEVVKRSSSTDAKKSELLKHHVAGGFPLQVYEALKEDPALLQEIARTILEGHFPDTIHADIMAAVGLAPEGVSVAAILGDIHFRSRILTVYEHKCAVCGLSIVLDHASICLEAAHIKWRQAGGPAVEQNGLALCTLHHKLFDRGAITIGTAMEIQVSERVHGAAGLDGWLMQFRGKKINPPVSAKYQPAPEYIQWHRRQVFQGPARE